MNWIVDTFPLWKIFKPAAHFIMLRFATFYNHGRKKNWTFLNKCTFEVVQTKLALVLLCLTLSLRYYYHHFLVNIIVIWYLHIGPKLKEKSWNIGIWNAKIFITHEMYRIQTLRQYRVKKIMKDLFLLLLLFYLKY